MNKRFLYHAPQTEERVTILLASLGICALAPSFIDGLFTAGALVLILLGTTLVLRLLAPLTPQNLTVPTKLVILAMLTTSFILLLPMFPVELTLTKDTNVPLLLLGYALVHLVMHHPKGLKREFFFTARKVTVLVYLALFATLALLLSTTALWIINRFVLTPLNAPSLQLLATLLISYGFSGAIYQGYKAWFEERSISLSFFSLDVILLSVVGSVLSTPSASLPITLLVTLGYAVGFYVAVLLLEAMLEQMSLVEVPKATRGIPIALMTLGLWVLALWGLVGL